MNDIRASQSHSTARKAASRPPMAWHFRSLAALCLCLFASTGAAVEDCGSALGDKTNPRIRSSAVRMLLVNPAEAYARFAPYAAMSALVYEEAEGCTHQLPPVENKEMLERALAAAGWARDDAVANLPRCDDDVGTFFRVWTKDHGDHLEVVIVFRGTKGGAQDWINGNLRWLTRVLPGDDQYDRSRRYTQDVLDYFQTGAGRPIGGKPLRFYSAGHSLGGGLAQNALYTFPTRFEQAYAFDPSPVTGYADNDAEGNRASCDCRRMTLGNEARVYRIYETDEILSVVRLPLKFLLPINRHIQEVRFNTGAGHSISHLASSAVTIADARPLGQRNEWWRGRDDAVGNSCTDVYVQELRASCGKPNNVDVCPQ